LSELPIVFLILLAIAILLRMDIVFYLVYVLVGTYGLARWWSSKSLRSLMIERRFTDHIFTGENSTVTIRLTNTSLLPAPWVRYDESPAAQLAGEEPLIRALALGPKETVEMQYLLVGRQRGVYPVGPGRLASGDLFGFVDLGGVSDEARNLVVYPRVIPLVRPALSSRAPHGRMPSRQPIYADPTRVNGVRSYMPGDPIRSIDWKTSARTALLQVKKYEPAVSLASAIFLDLRVASYSRHILYNSTEWAIVVAASVATYLIEERQEVGLGSNGRDMLTEVTGWTIEPRPGRAHLMKLLERLARVEAADTETLAAWLPRAASGLSWGSTVIAVAPTGDEATAASLHRLRRAGLNPVLLAVEPHAQFGLVRERCRRLGIAAHLVADEADLRRWQAAALPAGAVRPRGTSA
jgi:uncharacterized protein (DUF58 family)